MKAKTHKLKWHPSAEISSLLHTYIHYSVASFSELFKRKSLSFANLSLHGMALHGVVTWRFNILIETSLYFAQDQPCLEGARALVQYLQLESFWKKYPWWMKIHFQFHLIAVWSISASIFTHNSMQSSCKWLISFKAYYVY